MAKRWIVLLLALAVALAVVPLATAGPGGGWAHGKKKFNLVGTVVTVPDPTGPLPTTLTVYVKAGTKTVRAFRGRLEGLPLTVDPAARVRIVTAEGCVDGTLADLVQGMKVKVRGTIDRTDPNSSVFTAMWIKAKMMPTPEP